MPELNNVVKDLLKGKNPDSNFSIFCDEIKTLYYRQAAVQLAMEYDNFCEASKAFSDTNPVDDYVTGRIINNGTNDVDKMLSLRAEYIRRMENVTAFTDRFTKYEYILNRVEYRFKESVYDMDYYKNSFEDDIFRYIFSEKDNVVINTKISEIVGELPMRLSKSKFSDMIANAYSIYKGSEKKALDDFDFSLRVSGCIYPVCGAEGYESLCELEAELSKIDYSSIDADTCHRARQLCELAGDRLEKMITFYMDATAVLNRLIVLELCRGSFYDVKEEEAVKNAVLLSRKALNETVSEEDLCDCFSVFEGVQESISRRLESPDSSISEILEINKDALKGRALERKELVMISKLMSSSTFADIDGQEESLGLVDEEYASQKSTAIANDFAALFEKHDRLYRRAVMSAVCSMLPVFFNNTDEIKRYINVSLSQCSDDAEKAAVMEIISSLMYDSEE